MGNQYYGKSRLMTNYGWVQNSSNLSTIRDCIDLVPDDGIDHNSLMRAIYTYRTAQGDIKKKWEWDARCRIKAICACGLVELDRALCGYRLTPIGKQLKGASRSNSYHRKMRVLSAEEVDIFRQGLLTNPPVIRVLALLNKARRNGDSPLSKYDVGGQLGFAGDIGFTHFEPEFVVRSNKSFNDAEGDADKWARTIISWLMQVNWVVEADPIIILGKPLKRYTTTYEVDKVLQYTSRSTVKYIPQEMLCSYHHPFANIVQNRRVSILKVLEKKAHVTEEDLLADVIALGADTDMETLQFDILNLCQAGINISKERTFYRLTDKIKLDCAEQRISTGKKQRIDGIEKQIEHYVSIYADTIPSKLVDSLIRYGYDGTKSAALFEISVAKMFSYMGYDAQCLGQGHGRVADVIAKYCGVVYAKSYGLIIDTKAYEKYSFPAGDIRKMKEYIGVHGKELMSESIPNHAFAFVSMAFSTPDTHLDEIAHDTGIGGVAIDVFTLLKLGAMVAKSECDIANLYPKFTTNRLFAFL